MSTLALLIKRKKFRCICIGLGFVAISNSYAYVYPPGPFNIMGLEAPMASVGTAFTSGFATVSSLFSTDKLSQTNSLLNGMAGIDASWQKHSKVISTSIEAHSKVMDGIAKKQLAFDEAREQTRLYEQASESQALSAFVANKMESGARDEAIASADYATKIREHINAFPKASGGQVRRLSLDVAGLEAATGMRADDAKLLFPEEGALTEDQATLAIELARTLVDPGPMPEVLPGTTANPIMENAYIAERNNLMQQNALAREVFATHLARRTPTYDANEWAEVIWSQRGAGDIGLGGSDKLSLESVLTTAVKGRADNLEWHKFISAADDLTLKREMTFMLALKQRIGLELKRLEEQRAIMFAQVVSNKSHGDLKPRLKDLYVKTIKN